jgi:hypothetical protein
MPTVACYCEQCGQSFFLKDELYLPGLKNRYKFSRAEKKELKTWDDYVSHISVNCEDCRVKEVPKSCLEDYKKHKWH